MADKTKTVKAIEENGIIVILRGLEREELIKTVSALYEGGIRLVEVTFDKSGRTDDKTTAENIAMLVKEFAGKITVGAGTVLNKEQLIRAARAGAEFIISPDSCEEIIKFTVKLGLVSIPGAFTPTECANADRWGADFIKLFPNSEVRPSYLKALRAPLSDVKFLAVGGITLENMGDYLAAGACGIGVSSGIADRKTIRNGDFAEITARAKAYVDAFRGAYGN